MPRFKFTLRSKLIAFSVIIVTIIMADVTYFFTIRQLRDKRSAFESQMRRIAENIATMNLLDRQNWNDYQDYITRLMAFNDDIVYIAIYDQRNLLRAHTLNFDLVDVDDGLPLNRRTQAELVRRLDRGLIADESRDDLRVQRVNIQSGDRILGSVHVGFSLIEINNELQTQVTRNIAMAVFLILIYSLIATLLSRRLTRPLERLSRAMALISKGNLEQEVKVENRDEIGQLAKSFNQMVRGLRERDFIEKLGRDLSQSFNLEHLAGLVRNRLSEAMGANGARLFLFEKQAGGFREISGKNGLRVHELALDAKAQAILRDRTDGFLYENGADEVKEALKPIRVQPHEYIVPMLVKGRLFGLLIFLMKSGQKIHENQSHFASVLASQAAMALENARLYDELREQERVKRELEIAREVQSKLLPTAMPNFHGFEFDGICKPALEVGGDYFDFFNVDDEKLGIVIADVSGKGTSASFYMAEIKGMMSTLVSVHASPKRLMTELNRRLYSSLEKRVFATMLYGVLDVRNHSFTFVRAGHDSLLHLKRNGQCRMLAPAGIGLGLESGEVFERELQECVLRLKRGDSLLLFTDGITESMNERREQFGEERLMSVLKSNGAWGAVAIRERIFENLNHFVDGARQHDDLTMVVVHCRADVPAKNKAATKLVQNRT